MKDEKDVEILIPDIRYTSMDSVESMLRIRMQCVKHGKNRDKPKILRKISIAQTYVLIETKMRKIVVGTESFLRQNIIEFFFFLRYSR